MNKEKINCNDFLLCKNINNLLVINILEEGNYYARLNCRSMYSLTDGSKRKKLLSKKLKEDFIKRLKK